MRIGIQLYGVTMPTSGDPKGGWVKNEKSRKSDFLECIRERKTNGIHTPLKSHQ